MNATLDSTKAALPALGCILADKYEIVSVLGQGGMGIVYEALHRKLAQRVAIKVLLPEFLTDKKHVARFEREARLAARLRSEHTVRIFDVDTTPAGVPYIVMELLEGRDLADEVDARGDVSPSELVLWMRQICAAVEEAHRAGIIHRDLKPSNVFLCKVGDRTVAKVLDFGISKALHGGIGDVTATTTQDRVVGTPRYMSPEQVCGATEIDGRSDIWAIGVMMYRVLAGTYPFDGASGAQIAVAIANETAVNLRVHRPELPGSLVAIVMKALARRPQDRFATAGELACALEPLCNTSTPGWAASDPASLTSVTVHGLTISTHGGAPAPAPPRRARWSFLGGLGVALAIVAAALPLVASRAAASRTTPSGHAFGQEGLAPASAAAPLPLTASAEGASTAPTMVALAPSVSVAPAASVGVAPAASSKSRKGPERRPILRAAPAVPSASAAPTSDPQHI